MAKRSSTPDCTGKAKPMVVSQAKVNAIRDWGKFQRYLAGDYRPDFEREPEIEDCEDTSLAPEAELDF